MSSAVADAESLWRIEEAATRDFDMQRASAAAVMIDRLEQQCTTASARAATAEANISDLNLQVAALSPPHASLLSKTVAVLSPFLCGVLAMCNILLFVMHMLKQIGAHGVASARAAVTTFCNVMVGGNRELGMRA
jgi:hypothetical protein